MIQLYTGTDYPGHHTRRKGEALPQARRLSWAAALALHSHPVLDGPKVATLAT